METLYKIALILVIIGAINWGLVGLFQFEVSLKEVAQTLIYFEFQIAKLLKINDRFGWAGRKCAK